MTFREFKERGEVPSKVLETRYVWSEAWNSRHGTYPSGFFSYAGTWYNIHDFSPIAPDSCLYREATSPTPMRIEVNPSITQWRPR